MSAIAPEDRYRRIGRLIEAGSVVQLKSGGPQMTVEHVGNHQAVRNGLM
jgi:hypothetical protein